MISSGAVLGVAVVLGEGLIPDEQPVRPDGDAVAGQGLRV